MSILKNTDGELSIKLDNLTIRGKSVSGHHTSLIVEELKVVFDMGYQPEKIELVQNVLITHGHMDHFGCLPYCYASRKLQNIQLPWQVIMPKCYIPCFKSASAVASAANRGGYPTGFSQVYSESDKKIIEVIKPFEVMNIDLLIEAENCIDIPLISSKKNYFITAYEMKHKITSYGYIICEKRHKLKKEYLSLKGHEIKKLREEGIEIQKTIEIPTIAFTGDTTIDAILANNKFLQSNILIMECTHFDDSIENAIAHGHIHFQQIVDNIDKFQNKWIILCHLSKKYRQMADIEDYLKLLSEKQRKNIIIWL